MMTSDSHPQKENRPGAGRGNHHDDRDKSVKCPHNSTESPTAQILASDAYFVLEA
jgi:hypothetical protein